jgi:hypothetical protein
MICRTSDGTLTPLKLIGEKKVMSFESRSDPKRRKKKKKCIL